MPERPSRDREAQVRERIRRATLELAIGRERGAQREQDILELLFGVAELLAHDGLGEVSDGERSTIARNAIEHERSLPQQELDALFAVTDVGMVWGIGKRTTEKLKAGGIATVLDLLRADVVTLRRQFSVVVEKTVRELHGISCMELDDAPAPRQQILVSRSFGVPITHVDGILEAVSEFASRAAERLRQQSSVAGAIGVFFTTSPFRTNDKQHSVNLTVPLVRPTADTAVLMKAAELAVRTQFRPGIRYAKAGAVLSELQAVAREQGELDLFAAPDQPDTPAADPRSKLMTAMDALNNRFGRDSVRLGSTAVASNGADVAVWATKQERRSPRYTTRWNEILVVGV